MYIMASEPITTAYFTNPSHQFVSVCVSLLSLPGNDSFKCIHPFGARQQLGKHIPAATNTRYNRRIVGRVVFYPVRILSKENLCPLIVAR
jgi:hypothetical protein